MAHPYRGHGENAVGHRRAKFLTTGKQYARGGHSDEKEDRKLIKSMLKKEEKAEGKAAGGSISGGRLDKRARGGKVNGYQMGGGIRKFTPSKHKPHTSVHITNISRGGGGGGGAGLPRRPLGLAPPLGGPPPGGLPPGGPGLPGPGMGPPPIRPPGMKRGGRAKHRLIGGPAGLPAVAAARPVGLPAQAAPAAAAALAARPALPVQAQGVRPFKKGGPAKRASGGSIGKMRTGKKYGEGSGEGRLEEFHHMKGR